MSAVRTVPRTGDFRRTTARVPEITSTSWLEMEVDEEVGNKGEAGRVEEEVAETSPGD